MNCGERFAFVNILDNPDIRAELPKIANWPTFPQLWVEGELVGGCDIVVEMHQNGELEKLVKEAAQRAGAEDRADHTFNDNARFPLGRLAGCGVAARIAFWQLWHLLLLKDASSGQPAEGSIAQ